MGDIITQREKFQRGWKGGLPETPCGHGSKLSTTVEQRQWIPLIWDKFRIETVADIGAGDLNWIRHMQLEGVQYTPYDLVPRDESVLPFDLVRDIPPAVDCILCLWVINHMPLEDAQAAVRNIQASGARYLITTDRPIWHHEQPPEVQAMAERALEILELNDKGDRLLLVDLQADVE